MPGTAYGFHEGYRSEYLAHFFFSGIGTSVMVPQPEDYGIDLLCTLTTRHGKKLWPTHYFAVQVKSEMKAWEIEGEDAVDWFVKYDIPTFLAIVDKKSFTMKVYHTFPRFELWSVGGRRSRLALESRPEPGDGNWGGWSSDLRFDIGPPIFVFDLKSIEDTSFPQRAYDVLSSWLEYEQSNIVHVKNCVPFFMIPMKFRTGEPVRNAGISMQWKTVATECEFADAVERLQHSVSWIANQLWENKDYVGYANAAMLMRHLCHETVPKTMEFNSLLGKSAHEYAAIDQLAQVISNFINEQKASQGEAAG